MDPGVSSLFLVVGCVVGSKCPSNKHPRVTATMVQQVPFSSATGCDPVQQGVTCSHESTIRALNLVMLFLLIAATAAPERGLLFASTGAKPNGCAGHGPPESSKCGAGKENWVCKPTPKPQAPDCRECSDPFVEGIDSACDSDSSGRGNYTQFNYDCPITRVVTYPPECCHLGGAFVVEELHTAVTALLGTPGLESFCSTPGVCKEWANGTGFGTSSNGFAYGIKYTEIGGPNDGQDGCLINREVLNDEVCPPPLTLPLPPSSLSLYCFLF